MSSGTYTPCSACSTTGMPCPSFHTESEPASRSIVTLIVVIVGSRCLLSAAFTTISSKILYRPGTCARGGRRSHTRRSARAARAARAQRGAAHARS